VAEHAGFPAPDQIEGHWAWDKIHAPRPLTPMSHDIVTPAVAEGFTRAMREYYCAVGLQFGAFNCYAYARFMSLEFEGMTPSQRRDKYAETTLVEIVPNVGSLWRGEWLPSMLPGLERALSTQYESLSDEILVQTIDELQADNVDRWTVHGRINFILIAASWFADFYNEEFKPADQTEAYACLQGFNTLSVEAGRALWRLSREVKASSALSELFATLQPEGLMSALEDSAEGRAFLERFRDYLEQWGWRSDSVFEVADKTWREEPAIPLNTLQGYLHLGDEADPDVPYRESVARREEVLARARERLATHSDKLARFNNLYEAARDNLAVTEDHNYYIDQKGVAVLRLPLLDAGRRLGERGQLEQPDDVFYLRFEEMKQALQSGEDKKAAVHQRREEVARWARVVPPAFLGRPEALDMSDPFIAAMGGKMLGLSIEAEPHRDPDVLSGVAASPGVVQGIAKVVRNLNQASKLEPGDIMVCEMTLPPWTPLFATAAGIVADTGGVLSHCAIVAREYGLPAVVGTRVGTEQLKDGMTITVDGTKGLVRIDSR
jgi:phosphohistidine swiveling domain-containing protein